VLKLPIYRYKVEVKRLIKHTPLLYYRFYYREWYDNEEKRFYRSLAIGIYRINLDRSEQLEREILTIYR